MIIGIDPGSKSSGIVIYNEKTLEVDLAEHKINLDIFQTLDQIIPYHFLESKEYILLIETFVKLGNLQIYQGAIDSAVFGGSLIGLALLKNISYATIVAGDWRLAMCNKRSPKDKLIRKYITEVFSLIYRKGKLNGYETQLEKLKNQHTWDAFGMILAWLYGGLDRKMQLLLKIG